MINSVDWVVVGDNVNGAFWTGPVCLECRAGDELPSLGEWWKIVQGRDFGLEEMTCSLCVDGALLPWAWDVDDASPDNR